MCTAVAEREKAAAHVHARGDALAAYIAGAPARDFPPEVIDAALRALVDYIGVAVGASDDPVAKPVRRTVAAWKAQGESTIFMVGRTTPERILISVDLPAPLSPISPTTSLSWTDRLTPPSAYTLP